LEAISLYRTPDRTSFADIVQDRRGGSGGR
jgi:hypothetical protein